MNGYSTDSSTDTSTGTRSTRGVRRGLAIAATTVAAVAGLAVVSTSAPVVAAGLVDTGDLAKGAVTSKKIAKKAVKTKHLADGAVKSAKIKDGAVGTSKVADGAVTSAKIAGGSVTRGHLAADLQPLWAFVWGGPTINKGRGAVAVEALNPGNYKLTFDRDVSACGYTATLAAPLSTSPEQIGVISVSAFSSDAKAVNVRTRELDGTPAARGFTVQVWC